MTLWYNVVGLENINEGDARDKDEKWDDEEGEWEDDELEGMQIIDPDEEEIEDGELD
jgi:hypothetical protein